MFLHVTATLFGFGFQIVSSATCLDFTLVQCITIRLGTPLSSTRILRLAVLDRKREEGQASASVHKLSGWSNIGVNTGVGLLEGCREMNGAMILARARLSDDSSRISMSTLMSVTPSVALKEKISYMPCSWKSAFASAIGLLAAFEEDML